MFDEDARCKFCRIVGQPGGQRDLEDSLLAETEHFQWIPGLGPPVEGYSLVVSKKHVLNTGAHSPDVISELELLIARIRHTLLGIYATSSLVYEHGASHVDKHAGASIVHHHLHVLPVDMTAVPVLLSDRCKLLKNADSMGDLAAFNQQGIPYIYYETSLGLRFVYHAEGVPSQFLRRVVASCCAQPDRWDWRQFPFKKRIREFLKKLDKVQANE